MEFAVRLVKLPSLHPRLLWDPFLLAAAAVLGEGGRESPVSVTMEVLAIPGFGTGPLKLVFDVTRINPEHVSRFRRSFEPSRLVELGAIVVAAAGLSAAGGHQIIDLAKRGSGADYVVDAERYHLEVAGRSRRTDLEAGWEQKWARLRRQRPGGCYVCISEFETLTARLGFEDLKGGDES